jgi:hypothetical protein
MEQKVITNPIEQAGPGRRLLSNLFYGCGYNFYRCEDELHADDLLIRDCRGPGRVSDFGALWSRRQAMLSAASA